MNGFSALINFQRIYASLSVGSFGLAAWSLWMSGRIEEAQKAFEPYSDDWMALESKGITHSINFSGAVLALILTVIVWAVHTAIRTPRKAA
ncbi:hypothetical protein GGR95_002052 [Sulfitobacter undariae]|uniref:Uncharacterized protein n=1 Tax=Sulfitobacter undariae TaxID=1563671 RepID=A0A7W6E867_9RHOB|nr:hypothetical protein [Sulfitobacter undariae]MBB3994407.1 hypothetical protein [Sulfitobacter undariae]